MNLVSSYKVSMNGNIEGTLVNGTTFSSDLSHLVLVDELPNETNDYGILLDDGTLICEPVSSFAINYLIGTRLIIVVLGVVVLALSSYNQQANPKLIFQYSWVRGISTVTCIAFILLVLFTLMML